MDQVGAAVKAVEEREAEAQSVEEHAQVNLTITSTGRHVVFSYPVDLTDGELLEWIGFLGNNLRQALIAQRAAAAGPQLVVARALPQRPT